MRVLALVVLLFQSAFLAAEPLVRGQELLKGTEVAASAGAKGLVVAFLSAKCPCSDSHVAEIKKLKTDFPAFNFVAVHANADESTDVAKPYFKTIALGMPVLEDRDQVLANRFKALKTPHIFVLNAQGEVVYQGGVSDSRKLEKAKHLYLRETLAKLNAGEPIEMKVSRSLGCTIKRSKNVL